VAADEGHIKDMLRNSLNYGATNTDTSCNEKRVAMYTQSCTRP